MAIQHDINVGHEVHPQGEQETEIQSEIKSYSSTQSDPLHSLCEQCKRIKNNSNNKKEQKFPAGQIPRKTNEKETKNLTAIQHGDYLQKFTLRDTTTTKTEQTNRHWSKQKQQYICSGLTSETNQDRSQKKLRQREKNKD